MSRPNKVDAVKTSKKESKKSKPRRKVKKRVESNSNRQAAYKEVVEKRSKTTKSPDQLKLLINPEDTTTNPLTYHRLMDWLANTGWVEGYIRKRISPMDALLIEDYTQSIWVQILLIKPDLMMEIWYNGKGCFVNYIKRLIDIQLHCKSHVYNENKHFHHTHITLSDEQWDPFENAVPETMFTDSFPERYNCPSGNRKKMVIVQHDLQPISTDYDRLIDNQIYIDDEI